MPQVIRVLVVDDSALMRKVISDILSKEPDIEVIGSARNGKEALEKISLLNPDVITLDVEMPIMDGITALKSIMKENPRPVIMLSSLTQEGAQLTLRALQEGAIDFVPKPSGTISLDINKVAAEIVQKVRVASQAVLKRPISGREFRPSPVYKTDALSKMSRPMGGLDGLVLIGTSTGGPKALHEVIPRLPGDLRAAVLLVQHMPPGFTKSLAERLDQVSPLKVKEAEDGEEVLSGTVYIAPGDYHMLFACRKEEGKNRMFVELSKSEAVNGHRPAVDPMFMSAVECFASHHMVGVIMTGMGSDGARGLALVKERGGRTIAEDQSTCVVFGMPKSAIATGKVDKVVPLPRIADEIVSMLRN